MVTLKSILTLIINTILFVTIAANSSGQTLKDTIVDPGEVLPKFPGGKTDLDCFIVKNLNKKTLKSINISGVTIAQFTVDRNGMLKDIKITKSISDVIDKEFLRILQIMPRWIPAKKSNKSVSRTIMLPLRIPYENKFCR